MKKRRDNTATHFAVCLDNTGYVVSLEVGKLYQIIPDAEAEHHGYLRIIDESGEDYWHAASMFYVVELPRDLARTLRTVYRQAA
jgi:hypothetical protein